MLNYSKEIDRQIVGSDTAVATNVDVVAVVFVAVANAAVVVAVDAIIFKGAEYRCWIQHVQFVGVVLSRVVEMAAAAVVAVAEASVEVRLSG